MDLRLYGRALWSYKWLLLVGVLVAAAASLLSGFRIQGGNLESRAVHSYTASTTVLLTSNQSSLFRSENPGQSVPIGQSAPQLRDLSATAAVYAYLASGDIIRSATEASVGQLASGESIIALQRTTQPPSSDSTAGRLNLPVVAIAGTAATSSRAEQISNAAAQAFEAYVAQQQDIAKVPAGQRVVLVTLNKGAAVEAQGSNPYIGVVLVGAGVIAAFIALIFVLYNQGLRSGGIDAPAKETGKTKFGESHLFDDASLTDEFNRPEREPTLSDVGNDIV